MLSYLVLCFAISGLFYIAFRRVLNELKDNDYKLKGLLWDIF